VIFQPQNTAGDERAVVIVSGIMADRHFEVIAASDSRGFVKAAEILSAADAKHLRPQAADFTARCR